MLKQKTESFLRSNEIGEDLFYPKLYRTLLLGVFEVICKEMKKHNAKTTEKDRFRKYKDKIVPSKRIVKRYSVVK